MSLPLTLRKDIRDAEPKLAEIKKRIDGVLGFEVALEYNAEAIHPLLTEANHARKDAFGGPITGYFDNLAKQLEIICKDTTVREDLARVMTAKKIVFVVRKEDLPSSEPGKGDFGGSSMTGFEFKDGVFNIVVPMKRFWTNLGDLANPKEISIVTVLSRTCTPAATLPLHLRVRVRDTEAARQEAVKGICAALGTDIAFEFDPLYFYEGVSDHAQKDRFPDAVVKYLQGLRDNLTKSCKDAMIKEALVGAIKTKKLKFIVVKGKFPDPKLYGGETYVGLSFEHGDFNIVVPSAGFWTNMDTIANLKIEKLPGL